MNNIAVIGAGWLGQPLVKALLKEGHSAYATRTSSQRLEALKQQAIPCFALNIPSCSNSIQDVIQSFEQRKIKTVVGAFPPGFRKGKGEEYAKRWQALTKASIEAGVAKLIMVSSTTVYPDRNATFTENQASYQKAVNSDEFSENARTMLLAEQQLIDSGLGYVVMRYSGLFGPERHPARFVDKLSSVSRVAPVNMVHQLDAVNAAVFAITSLNNQVVNITSPKTVCKAEFYQQAIGHYKKTLTMPEFDNKPGKRISADKLCKLGFEFHYPDVLDGLGHC